MALETATADATLDLSPVRHLLGFRLALAEVGTRRVFQRHIGTPFQLRPVEFTLLMLLRANPAATPKRLAQALRLSPPNVTVLVDGWPDAGWCSASAAPMTAAPPFCSSPTPGPTWRNVRSARRATWKKAFCRR